MSKEARGLIRRWWWVVAFCTVISLTYFHCLNLKKGAVRELAFRLSELKKQKHLVFQQKEDLLLRISSENDPAWIEMILMRDLGVVPEGYLKVHFKR